MWYIRSYMVSFLTSQHSPSKTKVFAILWEKHTISYISISTFVSFWLKSWNFYMIWPGFLLFSFKTLAFLKKSTHSENYFKFPILFLIDFSWAKENHCTCYIVIYIYLSIYHNTIYVYTPHWMRESST